MTADLILQNGVVHTGSASRQLASAVAVTGGRIVAVGGARDIAAHRGPATREIDLQGGMLLPGFFDAHCHPAMAGHGMTQCTCTTSPAARRPCRRSASTPPGIPTATGCSAAAGTWATSRAASPPARSWMRSSATVPWR